MSTLFPSRRIRGTPFTKGVEAAGVKGYTVYNHMLLPTYFESVEADYHHLKRHVQVWDVAVERQVSIKGPDALRLMRLMSPRDMSKMADDQCYYVPISDHNGGMLNDPIAIKLAEDHYWLSIADGDLLQFALGLALGLGLEVEVTEPDVSPLAVQGPKADYLMARVFGDEVRDIRFFRYKRLAFQGRDFVVARSGWSKQGGFEIYVEGGDYGMPLWDALFAAGEDLNVRAGCPNLIERIEAGLLSYGNDMTRANTPIEAGLAKFCNSPDDYLGKAVIEAQKAHGPDRIIRAVDLTGQGDLPPIGTGWSMTKDGAFAGSIGAACWSPDFNTHIAVAMVERAYWDAGTQMTIDCGNGSWVATVKEKFWI